MIPLNQIKIGLSTRHRNEEVPNGKWEVLLREVPACGRQGRAKQSLFIHLSPPKRRRGLRLRLRPTGASAPEGRASLRGMSPSGAEPGSER